MLKDCDKCAKKYVRGHKCSKLFQLHVVQELWELLQLEELSDVSDSSLLATS